MKCIASLILSFIGKPKSFYIHCLFIVSILALKLVLFFIWFLVFFLHNLINVYACLTANPKTLLELSFVYETILCPCCIERLTTFPQQEKDPETANSYFIIHMSSISFLQYPEISNCVWVHFSNYCFSQEKGANILKFPFFLKIIFLPKHLKSKMYKRTFITKRITKKYVK